MKRPDVKQNTARLGVDSIFVLTVFVLFICTLLASVLTFALLYKQSGEKIEHRFTQSTTGSLILQKLKAYDTEGAISISQLDGKDVLCFKEQIEGSGYITYIYCHDGNLCELFVEENHQFNASEGTPLIAADNFTARLDNGEITFQLSFIDNNGESVSYSHAYCIKSDGTVRGSVQ